jgi:hypothetical protein
MPEILNRALFLVKNGLPSTDCGNDAFWNLSSGSMTYKEPKNGDSGQTGMLNWGMNSDSVKVNFAKFSYWALMKGVCTEGHDIIA